MPEGTWRPAVGSTAPPTSRTISPSATATAARSSVAGRKPPEGTGCRVRPMAFSDRQMRALATICDTFAPGADGLPSASELGVPQAVADAVDMNPRAAERRQTAQLLGLWDTIVMAALAGAGVR